MREQFIPTLKERGIKKVIFGGDLFEYRTHINVKIKNAVFDLFQNDLADFDCYVLVGNHDIYFNTTLKVNSVKYLGLLPNVKVIEEITPVDFYGKKFLLVPWQVDDQNFIDYMSKCTETYEVCICHYAIQGFLLMKSKIHEEGISGDIFYKYFKLIISGHFHIRNSQTRNGSEILYMGCPWHLSRSDIGEEKGGLILDVPSLKYEFIDNKKSLRFVSLVYPNLPKKEEVEGNLVDIYVEYNDDYDDDKVHDYIKTIEGMNPLNPPSIKIENKNVSIDIDDQKIKNTHELMQDYVYALSIDNPDEIFQELEKLYEEAKGEF